MLFTIRFLELKYLGQRISIFKGTVSGLFNLPYVKKQVVVPQAAVGSLGKVSASDHCVGKAASSLLTDFLANGTISPLWLRSEI